MKTNLFELSTTSGFFQRKSIKELVKAIVRAFPGSKLARSGTSLIVETPFPITNTELFNAIDKSLKSILNPRYRCADHEFTYRGDPIPIYYLCPDCKAARAEVVAGLVSPPIPPDPDLELEALALRKSFESELDDLEQAGEDALAFIRRKAFLSTPTIDDAIDSTPFHLGGSLNKRVRTPFESDHEPSKAHPDGQGAYLHG